MTLGSLVGMDVFEVDLAWYNGPKTSKLVGRISELTLGQKESIVSGDRSGGHQDIYGAGRRGFQLVCYPLST